VVINLVSKEARKVIPKEIWEMIKWVGIISSACIWALIIIRAVYKFFFEDEVK
jgi:hypothetical protein